MNSLDEYFRLSHLFGVSEETFLRVTSEVMDAFLSQIRHFINWPQENELGLYAAEFDTFGRQVDMDVAMYYKICHILKFQWYAHPS